MHIRENCGNIIKIDIYTSTYNYSKDSNPFFLAFIYRLSIDSNLNGDAVT